MGDLSQDLEFGFIILYKYDNINTVVCNKSQDYHSNEWKNEKNKNYKWSYLGIT